MNGQHKRPRGETRELVRRFYVRGLPVREIAAKTGISVQMVAGHVRSLVDAGEVEPRKPRRKSA